MGFFDDFFGVSQRRDIRRGQQQGLADVNAGETGALSDYDLAVAGFDPYSSGGQQGYNAYLASLGLRGDAARQEVQDTYFRDPVQNALMDRITRANTRRFTGVGMGNSGAATQSLTNALLANYGAYQDRLKGVGEGGMAAAGARSGTLAQRGNLQFGAGQQRAAIDMGAANATAASRSTGINNLLNLAGTAVNAYGAYKGVPAARRAP